MVEILNFNRTYKHHPLLLGEQPGVYDTIHVNQEIFDLHKRAVAQIWQADEFNFAPCAGEFLEQNDGRDLMIQTLLWQWTADSVVVNLYTLLQPFITDDSLTQLVLFNTYIESIHSQTYSEIVKNAFKTPVEVLNSIKQDQPVLNRLNKVIEVFTQLREIGLQYSQGLITKEQAFPHVYKGIVTLYLMERIQFIASFAITFTLGEMGRFQPVCMAVRKICADELIIHADTDELILKDLQKDPLWPVTNTPQFHQEIVTIVEEIVNRELEWTDVLFENRTLPGINAELIKEWVLFNAQVVKTKLNIEHDNKHKQNPLPYLKSWITMNALQAAPQEQEMGQYLIGGITNDLENLSDIDLDF